MPNLSGPQLLVILGLFGAAVSLPLAALVDARTFSPAKWQQVGHNRQLWVGLLAVGIPVCVLGVVVAIEYVRTVRPMLKLAPG